MKTVHPIPAFVPANAEILILGSFPSVKSRETGFFYGHKQNRFWKVLSAVFSDEEPETIGEKKAFLERNKVALWDVIGSCEITGSSDASIKNAEPNDISSLVNNTGIKKIFLNGKTAEKYYKKYVASSVEITAKALPSTSPANAAFSLEMLIEEWKEIRR